METRDFQILNLKFGQVMSNSLVFKWERNFKVTFGIVSALASQINVLERNFEVTFGIFSVLVSVINVLESYLDVYLF